MDFGSRCAEARRQKGMSQEELAEAIGVTRQTIYKWENNITVPDITKLAEIATALAVSTSYLLGEEQSAPTPLPEQAEVQTIPLYTQRKSSKVFTWILIAAIALLLVVVLVVTLVLILPGNKDKGDADGGDQVTACKQHSPGEWITVAEPGEETDGKREKRCTVCGKALEAEAIEATGTVGLLFFAVNENEYGVRAGESLTYAERIVIPKTYRGKPVTQILDQAFGTTDAAVKAPCVYLKSVIIPDTITKIEEYAFARCAALESITLPEGITSIEPFTFIGCTALTHIVLPSTLTELKNAAFSGCRSLASISLPTNLLRIEDFVFSACEALVSVTLPEGLKFLGNNAFVGCKNLTSLSIPSSLEECEFCTIYEEYKKLQFYTLNNVKYLGNEQDKYLLACESADTELTTCILSATTRFVASMAFGQNYFLQVLVLPKSLRSIGYQAVFTDYYYAGTAAEWENVILADAEIYSDYIKAGENLYFYSETQPSDTGHYWHYVSGVPTRW